ncbi:flagellar filament capping protein FliD [Treponema pectinovorum]|uniref:flagellar filament capping protein FliD n=1 Tax=Treponema pectinovorum TaxID=164 RepID=UPI0011C8CD5C|nr:flagellar filament capping protein FliD [Treponema pectinovorum]
MPDISIPGVSDKYKTNDYIQALMKKERLPLTREQESLDRYKEQQSAWNEMNQKMSSLRTNTKTLYSFDNPFNNKLASSTDENAVTATPGRQAEYGSIKIDVIKPATSDRFLSENLEKDFTVPQGKYTFQVDEKTVSFNWRGGKLTDFVNSLNKRGSSTIKASLVGVSGEDKSLLIESVKTGDKNNLIFKDDALSFAVKHGIIAKMLSDKKTFGLEIGEYSSPEVEFPIPEVEQEGMPEFSLKDVEWDSEENRFILPPRAGLEINIPEEIFENANNRIEFSYSTFELEDITEELNIIRSTRPELQEAGKVTYEDVTILNDKSEASLPPVPPKPLEPIKNEADFYVKNGEGKETKIKTESLSTDSKTGEKTVMLDLKDYPDLKSIVVRNRNTGEAIALSTFTVYDAKKDLGFEPVNPVSKAGDAVIKYEGITINRPTNNIDDVIPHVTLNIFNPTEKTATIDIKPDKESAKDALISFVGTYNQVIAEMNILSENKPEIISELDYLSSSEKEDAQKKLGIFLGDSSLRSGKSALQSIISASYKWSENADITMLNQLGISTRATGTSGGYTASQLRGYLEINEKKLDESLEKDLDSIKNLFGYDSDGDLIVDSGIGFALDKQLTAWVQSGGIISNKTATLNGRIKSSETKIASLERQLETKEAQLRTKYGQMEGTLNSLNSQSSTISNFANNGRQQ